MLTKNERKLIMLKKAAALSMSLLLSLAVVTCQKQQQIEEEFRKPVLLYTKAHGERNARRPLVKLSKSMGINFVTSKTLISTKSLLAADLLYIISPKKPFTDEEK